MLTHDVLLVVAQWVMWNNPELPSVAARPMMSWQRKQETGKWIVEYSIPQGSSGAIRGPEGGHMRQKRSSSQKHRLYSRKSEAAASCWGGEHDGRVSPSFQFSQRKLFWWGCGLHIVFLCFLVGRDWHSLMSNVRRHSTYIWLYFVHPVHTLRCFQLYVRMESLDIVVPYVQ